MPYAYPGTLLFQIAQDPFSLLAYPNVERALSLSYYRDAAGTHADGSLSDNGGANDVNRDFADFGPPKPLYLEVVATPIRKLARFEIASGANVFDGPYTNPKTGAVFHFARLASWLSAPRPGGFVPAQSADGGFVGLSDPYHTASLFGAKAGVGLVLRKQAGLPAAFVASFAPTVTGVTDWMALPATRTGPGPSQGIDQDKKFGHRYKFNIERLLTAGLLQGDPYHYRTELEEWTAGLEGWIKDGSWRVAVYANQADGTPTAGQLYQTNVNQGTTPPPGDNGAAYRYSFSANGCCPELDQTVSPNRFGFDVGYQAFGDGALSESVCMAPADPLRDRWISLLSRSLSFITSRIKSDGTIVQDADCRDGVETSRTGSKMVKKPDVDGFCTMLQYGAYATGNAPHMTFDGVSMTPYALLVQVASAAGYFRLDQAAGVYYVPRPLEGAVYVAPPPPVLPTLASLSPVSLVAGNGAMTLTVNGTGFAANSIVKWNGVSQKTMFVSPTQLTATIPASLTRAAGTVSITVTTPSVATTTALPFLLTPPAAGGTGLGGTGGASAARLYVKVRS